MSPFGQKIGVLITINESNLPLEIDRIKHNLCDKLGPLLERYRGQVSFLRNPEEAKSTKISTLLQIRHFDYGTNPNRTGRIAGATILFGPLGALAQHRLEPPNIKINNWAITITDLSSSELEYERRENFQNFGEIFVNYNLSEELRKAVVWAWIAQREEAPLGFLKIIFNDEDPYFRSKIIKALGNISKPPIEFLTDALKDRDSSVRSEAAYALGKIKDTKGVEPLIAALKDGNLNVRWRAAEALGDITGKNFGEDPVKWQEWWDKNKAK